MTGGRLTLAAGLAGMLRLTLAGLVVAVPGPQGLLAQEALSAPPPPRPDDLAAIPDSPPAAAAVAAAPRRPKPRPGSTATEVTAANAALGLPGLRPRPRPPQAQRVPVVQVAAATLPPAASLPRPLPRPENLQRLSAAATMRVQPVPEAITGRAGSVCGRDSLRGTPIPPIRERIAACGLTDGVEVTRVAGLSLSQPIRTDCTTARALDDWVERGVKPAVGRLGGGAVRLQIAGSYACRARNNQRGEVISEHGRGKAVDVAGIGLANGVTITVLKGWSDRQHGKILKSAHKSACGTFGTVLGPNSDSFHRDHLHLDTVKRNSPYCR
ncbi:extensin-like domain-containing protein [Frigidibacter oleivorans]|uniref:extensin-like domain-containing protein n=1 Tax=Frigidibacter oleivorans TaxID=2487129 RepID=UPI001F2968A4|nr:extensin family protein [Frigidibacter oleivorans]